MAYAVWSWKTGGAGVLGIFGSVTSGGEGSLQGDAPKSLCAHTCAAGRVL